MVQVFLSDRSLMSNECCSDRWFWPVFQGLGLDVLLGETYDSPIESFLVLSLSSLLCSHHPLSSPPLICSLVVEQVLSTSFLKVILPIPSTVYYVFH